ncbi:protein-L-isoaspartate O-methyltransferase [Candidatus Saccharibacteria bacterium]|nr:protein-L-isoaspartate O-methyltransferase [Candidatus Saccharibacteria bacterium]
MLPDLVGSADFDMPLPIGFGQTISQPTTVRLMLGWLEPQLGDKVLDVGSGSGWTTALLAHLVGPSGKVYAVELVPELVKFGRQNCSRIGIKNARIYQAGRKYGLPKEAPFERILVSAAAEELPTELIDQLSVGGKMVIPVRNDILEIEKTSAKDTEVVVHSGFVFVPLVPSERV